MGRNIFSSSEVFVQRAATTNKPSHKLCGSMASSLHLLNFLYAVLGRGAAKAFADAQMHFRDFSPRETIASQEEWFKQL